MPASGASSLDSRAGRENQTANPTTLPASSARPSAMERDTLPSAVLPRGPKRRAMAGQRVFERRTLTRKRVNTTSAPGGMEMPSAPFLGLVHEMDSEMVSDPSLAFA